MKRRSFLGIAFSGAIASLFPLFGHFRKSARRLTADASQTLSCVVCNHNPPGSGVLITARDGNHTDYLQPGEWMAYPHRVTWTATANG